MAETNNTQQKVIDFTLYSRKLPFKDLPRENLDVWVGYFPSIPHLRICLHTRARMQILRHAYSLPEVEVGGVLLGDVYRSNTRGADDFPIDFIEIRESIIARNTAASSGSLTFTPRSWADINLVRDRFYQQERFVGWYHTHPGHGVFLSGHDLNIHNNFFSQEFNLALVIETKQNEGGFFVDSNQLGGPYPSERFTWDHPFFLSMRNALPQEKYRQYNLHQDQPTAQLTDPTQPATDGVEVVISADDLQVENQQRVHNSHPKHEGRTLEPNRSNFEEYKSLLWIIPLLSVVIGILVIITSPFLGLSLFLPGLILVIGGVGIFIMYLIYKGIQLLFKNEPPSNRHDRRPPQSN